MHSITRAIEEGRGTSMMPISGRWGPEALKLLDALIERRIYLAGISSKATCLRSGRVYFEAIFGSLPGWNVANVRSSSTIHVSALGRKPWSKASLRAAPKLL